MIGTCVIAPRCFPLCHDSRAAGRPAQSACLAASREGEAPMPVFTHGLSTDRCIAFSDDELVDKTFELIGLVEDCEAADVYEAVGELATGLYFLVEELLERFSPEAARAATVRLYTDDDEHLRDPDDGNNLLDALEGLKQSQAARLLRDALSESTDA
jgi:hypothetical protein